MLRVVSAAEMAAMDRKTIQDIGIPGIVLMEVAGRGIYKEIEKYLEDVTGKSVVIFCGKGNNGGDGYVVARHLVNAGASVHVYLAGEKKDVRGDALINLKILEKLSIDVIEVSAVPDMELPLEIDLIVDALLGTGMTGPVRGMYGQLVDVMNAIDVPVVAVDLPTGMDTDRGQIHDKCVIAETTVTMAHLKRGLLFSPARDFAGAIAIVDIGVPPEISEELHRNVFMTELEDIAAMLPQRDSDAHKTAVGKVVVFAGSVGMTGAATLTSISTLQTGAGLTKLGIPATLNPIVEQKLTEVMSVPLPETDRQSLSIRAAGKITELLAWSDILAVGPGLSLHEETIEFVKWLLQHADKPMVLDADGLNALSGDLQLIKNYKSDMILTPHPGELSRLINQPISDIMKNPIEVVRTVASEIGAVIVLKGGPTLIADPEGDVYINSSGNAGMATGGSGDVLTGIIAGLWGQQLNALEAAVCGVYVHGLAGDLAADELTERGMIASDLNRFLPRAFKYIEQADLGEP